MKEASRFQPHSYFVRGIHSGLERELCEPLTCIFLFGCSGYILRIPPNFPPKIENHLQLPGGLGGFRSVC